MRINQSLPWIVGAVLGFAPGAVSAQAALKDSVPHVTVVGHASMEVVPDVAILSLSVVTERPKADDAAAENARTAQAVIDDIKAQGIDAHDVTTTSVTLSADYEDLSEATNRPSKQVLRGYIARNSIAVRIHALATAGALARRLIDKGANQVDDISFGYEHEDDAYDKLRGEAVRDALRRAKDYLPAVGLSLGRVLEISPGDGSEPRLAAATAAPMSRPDAAASIPIEPGTLTLETDVQVTWELTQ